MGNQRVSAAIIFALLLFISYEVNQFYAGLAMNNDNDVSTRVSGSNKKINKSYYYSYEEKIENAARMYIKDNAIAVPDAGETVYVKDLVDLGYIDKLYDYYSNNICSGYAIVRDNNYTLNAKAYIKCTNYVTEGY